MLRSRDENFESSRQQGNSEECHMERTSGKVVEARPLSCEHWT